VTVNKDKAVGIIGIGSYVPAKMVTNKDMEQIVDTSDEWIVDRTGIKARHFVAEGEHTSDIATKAAERALLDANLTADDIDLVVVATATPDMLFPSTACLVQHNLNATHAAAYDLSAGCSGFMYAIATSSQFIKTGLYKHVLVIGAETLSRLMDFTDRNTCVLFGDGAGAVVLGEVPAGYGILGIHLGSDGGGGPLLSLPAGGTRIPATEESVKQRLHYIHMEGNEVFKFAVKVMGEAAMKALDDAGIKSSEVDWLIPHQANIRIIQSAARRLKMPAEKVVINVDRYGNTSSASIPIALEEAIHDGRIKAGQTIVMVGFGAGLTWAATVIRWHHK
jgi:3-oxoacyl-[acyl-carrier-protein] synthase-3